MQLVSNRAPKYYQVDVASEAGDLLKPKVICSIFRARLSNLETGKLTITKWELDRNDVEFSRIIEKCLCVTRGTVGCNSEYRCHFCQIFASSLNIYMISLKIRPLDLVGPCHHVDRCVANAATYGESL